MAMCGDDEEIFPFYEQCPCEFCGRPFPFEIIIEHETGCRSDLTSLGVDDLDYTTERTTADIVDDVIAPEVEKMKVEIKQRDENKTKVKNVTMTKEKIFVSDVSNNAIDKGLKNSLSVSENSYAIKKTEEMMQTSSAPKHDLLYELKQNEKFKHDNEQIKDYLLSCTGERLMSFGSPAADTTKECDKENQIYNDCIDDIEDFEDINNLSDDDCHETLEEFWKRAKDILKCHRVKNI